MHQSITLTTISTFLLVDYLLITTSNGAKPSFHQSSAQEHRMIQQDRAILHVNMMNTIGMCRIPRPIIIYPPSSSNKHFLPRGTIIHRCTDQTGCCPNSGEVCRPDNVVEVEKVFFVNHLVINGQKVSGHRMTPRLKIPKQNFTTMTETITFLNHTACKCVKLAPNSIEHDELHSVISRPLVVPINTFASNTFFYHMVGTVSLIALILILLIVYRCFFHNYDHVRHNRV